MRRAFAAASLDYDAAHVASGTGRPGSAKWRAAPLIQ